LRRRVDDFNTNAVALQSQLSQSESKSQQLQRKLEEQNSVQIERLNLTEAELLQCKRDFVSADQREKQATRQLNDGTFDHPN
jgi:Tfp pilus assembly protein PilF